MDAGAAVLTALCGAESFSAAMATRPWARSPHFFVHYVPVENHQTVLTSPAHTALSTKLSTELPTDSSLESLGVQKLGMVVPKRHARRAVTRVLLRRQIRAAMAQHRCELLPGIWVVRLRAPVDRQAFVSASSESLRIAVKAEVATLLGDVLRRCRSTRHAAQAPAQPAFQQPSTVLSAP
ncbi:ribonuclease P protein component [Leptothrix ochracea]|uniref:ribonuclease P protein component n=1 Tax=Leptothrix ochracea TaxID=735331 RepID=UPI0034E2FC15